MIIIMIIIIITTMTRAIIINNSSILTVGCIGGLHTGFIRKAEIVEAHNK